MNTIKIFLASSSELESDRKEFEIFINRKNKEYIKDSVFLELVLWEDFLDAMSPTRLQDEYNKAIAGCDVFVSLFHTKVGKYTEEEFIKALETFKANGKPLIYTYFKDKAVNMSKINSNIVSLINFKQKLSDLGHFYTNYADINDLKFQFNNQLTKLLPELTGSSSSKNEQHSDNKPQTVTKVEQHFNDNVGIATGNIEGNQNLKDINIGVEREDIPIQSSNNSRLETLLNRKEGWEQQIINFEKMSNNCNQQIKGESDLDKISQLNEKIENYSVKIDELYDKIDQIQDKINKI